MSLRLFAAWLLGLFLCVGLGLVIWRTAPIAMEDVRLVAAAVPVVLWGVAALVFAPRSATPSLAMAPPVAEDGLPVSRWKATLSSTLKARRLSGSRARYRVPLYLLIGPAGMGKSTLMERSELDLDAPLSGDGATWWVGSDAIIVEVTTGGGREDAVLRSLAKFRPAGPVNGVILAVSPADLTLADSIERREIGDAIARTLTRLEALTRARVPVYTLLTKLDLTPGFSEFFDRMEVHERQQLWGFSLPADFGGLGSAAASLKTIGNGIRQMVDGTRLRLIEWLSRESDPLRGGRILTFGAQIAALDPIVDSILKPLLPSDIKKRRGAFLRGIYLTSARQEALSIDPLLPELAERYAMPRIGTDAPDLSLAEEEDGYFVGGTLRKAVFSEAGLVQRSPRAWYRKPLWGASVATATVALCLLAAYPIVTSYAAWRDELARVSQANSGVGSSLRSGEAEDFQMILNDVGRLEAMQMEAPVGAFPRGLLRPARFPAQVDETYDDALRNSVMPHLVARLEADLVDLDADPATLLDRQIAATPSADRTPALMRWLEAQAARMPDGASRAALIEHGARAFALEPDTAVAADYLDASRRIVAYKDSQP